MSKSQGNFLILLIILQFFFKLLPTAKNVILLKEIPGTRQIQLFKSSENMV